MSLLRNFLYRFPRFHASNRVDFISGDTIHLGVCLEISESGLRGTFSGTIPPRTEGLITLYKDERSFSAHGVILEILDEEVTARFHFQSPQEEIAIQEFIKSLSLPAEF